MGKKCEKITKNSIYGEKKLPKMSQMNNRRKKNWRKIGTKKLFTDSHNQMKKKLHVSDVPSKCVVYKFGS